MGASDAPEKAESEATTLFEVGLINSPWLGFGREVSTLWPMWLVLWCLRALPLTHT